MTKAAMGMALVLVAAAAVVHSQSTLAGRWVGETPNGRALALDLKTDGAKLTGTLTVAKDTVPLSDGTTAKNTFSFKAQAEGQLTLFTGEFNGDELTLRPEAMKNPVVLKRAK